MEQSELVKRFTYHPPKAEKLQPQKYEMIRRQAFELATLINDCCPDGREKSLAMTYLEECVMWANASIARRS